MSFTIWRVLEYLAGYWFILAGNWNSLAGNWISRWRGVGLFEGILEYLAGNWIIWRDIGLFGNHIGRGPQFKELETAGLLYNYLLSNSSLYPLFSIAEFIYSSYLSQLWENCFVIFIHSEDLLRKFHFKLFRINSLIQFQYQCVVAVIISCLHNIEQLLLVVDNFTVRNSLRWIKIIIFLLSNFTYKPA